MEEMLESQNPKETKKSNKKLLIILSVAIFTALILVLAGSFYLKINKGNNVFNVSDPKNEPVQKPTEKAKEKTEQIKFDHKIFDPNKVSYIVPLGELNGGYIETQTINGVCVFNKTGEPLEIHAPADMTLKYYAFMPAQGKETANYQMTFTISKDVEMTFHHITSVSDELKEAMPQTSSSANISPHKEVSLKGGQLIGKTTGTAGHNWNIYLTDKKHTNKFVNGERYEKLKDRYAFVNAMCPFDFYEDSVKQTYLALMGATKAGQSATCGSNSKDVKGSIAGLWHLSNDVGDMMSIMGKYDGQFATPFSVYKDSAGQIVIYEIGRKRYILGNENPTYKDPATITAEHCYNLSQYPRETRKGYAYFKVVGEMEIKVAYSASGSCPAQFPEGQGKTYYR